MGFPSYYEDNQETRGESLRRSSRQQRKKREAVKTEMPNYKFEGKPLTQSRERLESQQRLERSARSTRTVGGHQGRMQTKKKRRKSQQRLERSAHSTRTVGGHQGRMQTKKKRRNWMQLNTDTHQKKKTQRLTFDDVQQCLLKAKKWRRPRTVLDWTEYIRVHFERSNRELVPSETLHRFVYLALYYLEIGGVMTEDLEGRWRNRTQNW